RNQAGFDVGDVPRDAESEGVATDRCSTDRFRVGVNEIFEAAAGVRFGHTNRTDALRLGRSAGLELALGLPPCLPRGTVSGWPSRFCQPVASVHLFDGENERGVL